ncbi:MAG: hypothetical protein FWG87_00615 [Defluviitaleaceae bacterium]|nr:hypothetical protein [Defluviitaleaceae bacterium]
MLTPDFILKEWNADFHGFFPCKLTTVEYKFYPCELKVAEHGFNGFSRIWRIRSYFCCATLPLCLCASV